MVDKRNPRESDISVSYHDRGPYDFRTALVEQVDQPLEAKKQHMKQAEKTIDRLTKTDSLHTTSTTR